MPKKSVAGNGGVGAEVAAVKSAAKAVSKEAGSGERADSAVKASGVKGKGAAEGKGPIEITGAMIAEAAYFLHMNGVPGTPEEHWAIAEGQLRSKGSAGM